MLESMKWVYPIMAEPMPKEKKSDGKMAFGHCGV